MRNCVVARCEGCKEEIVLAQEESGNMAHLSSPEFEAFLRAHEGCRSRVAKGPYITRHSKAAD